MEAIDSRHDHSLQAPATAPADSSTDSSAPSPTPLTTPGVILTPRPLSFPQGSLWLVAARPGQPAVGCRAGAGRSGWPVRFVPVRPACVLLCRPPLLRLQFKPDALLVWRRSDPVAPLPLRQWLGWAVVVVALTGAVLFVNKRKHPPACRCCLMPTALREQLQPAHQRPK